MSLNPSAQKYQYKNLFELIYRKEAAFFFVLCTWSQDGVRPASPPCDFKLVDGPFAVIMIDKVLVADADALLLSRDATLRQVAHDAVEQVVNVRHRLPGSEGDVHLAVVLEELDLVLGALEAQGVEKWTLVGCDGHLFLVDADLQLGKPGLLLHGPQLGNLNDALQIV